jgi:hypothetical protein
MLKHLLILTAAAAFAATPVAAHRGAASDSKTHSTPCKSPKSDEHAQAPAAKPAAAPPPTAEAPTGNFLSHGWLSFFGLPSSPLLP